MTTRPVVHVEKAVAADIAGIAALEQVAFSDPWSPASFESVLAESFSFVAVARDEDGSDVAGYVVAWFAADEGEIANLAVREPTRRRGVGSALLDAAIAEAVERQTRSLYLEVRESNAAARALYASRNFEEVGRRRRYYRRPVEDAIVLRRVMPENPAMK